MASKRKERRDSCQGKRRYETRQEALDATRHIRCSAARPMRVYPCRWCRGYHVGHMPTKYIRAMERGMARHG
jgi:hypothetical protein